MLNQSTINGTRFFGGSVNATDVGSKVVRVDRADSQHLHLGKRLQKRCRMAKLRELSPAVASYAPASAASESWRLRIPAGRTSPAAMCAATDLPARVWAALVVSRAL
jgi:hypothetical protein